MGFYNCTGYDIDLKLSRKAAVRFQVRFEPGGTRGEGRVLGLPAGEMIPRSPLSTNLLQRLGVNLLWENCKDCAFRCSLADEFASAPSGYPPSGEAWRH